MLTLTFTFLFGLIWLALWLLLILPAQILWWFLTLPMRPFLGNAKTQTIQIKVKIR